MGAESKLKAAGAGDKEGKPPQGTTAAEVEPTTPGASSPARYLLGRLCKCRKRFNAGVPGAKPLA